MAVTLKEPNLVLEHFPIQQIVIAVDEDNMYISNCHYNLLIFSLWQTFQLLMQLFIMMNQVSTQSLSLQHIKSSIFNPSLTSS